MKSTQKKVSGADLPTRWHGVVFECKAWGLRMQRAVQNIYHRIPRHAPGQHLPNGKLLSESSSPLWSGEETARMLVAGKIHNLRQAARHLDGLVIPAGKIFSFWKQIGRATHQRGYAQGRELREGCIIPTIGGGLCQLSNGIYDAALQAGLEVVERHRHSQVIAGSLAEQDRDATVFWNYRDLRIRASHPWLLQVKIDGRHLSVRILADKHQDKHIPLVAVQPQKHRAPDAMGDCTQCGRTDCYLHVGDIPLHTHKTWLVTEEEWPEFAQWRQQQAGKQDKLLSTVAQADAAPPLGTRIANFNSRLMRRFHIWRGHPLPVAHNSRFSHIARNLMRKLDASDTHLVIPQSLLPWLWMAGELRGREYDVLMTALPIPDIQRRLDEAVQLYPQTTTLSDFRADQHLMQAEQEALAAASHWVTPHAEILKLAGAKGIALPWLVPELKPTASEQPDSPGTGQKPKVMLAASSLARKGVYELREALRTLDMPVQLLLPPGAAETPDLWDDFNVQRTASMLGGIRQADVVVLPAWVEHMPRGLLQAIALGKPVLATPACGLTADLAWTPITPGDVEGLKQAIANALKP